MALAVGTQSDFIIYEDEFFAGAYEVIEQNVQVFNGPSRGTMILVPERRRGRDEREAGTGRREGAQALAPDRAGREHPVLVQEDRREPEHHVLHPGSADGA